MRSLPDVGRKTCVDGHRIARHNPSTELQESRSVCDIRRATCPSAGETGARLMRTSSTTVAPRES